MVEYGAGTISSSSVSRSHRSLSRSTHAVSRPGSRLSARTLFGVQIVAMPAVSPEPVGGSVSGACAYRSANSGFEEVDGARRPRRRRRRGRGSGRRGGSLVTCVACIVPSMVDTETVARNYGQWWDAILADQVVDRPQQPDDLAGLLVLLVSPTSEFVTGQTLVAAGGHVFL